MIENIVEPFYKTKKFDFLYKIYYNINIKINKKGKNIIWISTYIQKILLNL